MYKVALIGRPNVGKSSIFNRLVGKKQAITTDVPGTTRDWNEHTISLGDGSFCIADTAGVEKELKDELKKKVKSQFEQNIAGVELIFFVVDASTGITAEDQKIAEYLRKLKKETILVINKADTIKSVAQSSEFYKLGFGDPIEVSAIQNKGTSKILEKISDCLPPVEAEKSQDPSTPIKDEGQSGIRVSIVGRPNAGKSSFLNKLIDEEKFIVSEVPGTTRDVNSTVINYKDEDITFLDTAGLRRRGKIGKVQGKSRDGIVEKFSADRTKTALEESDISILIIDAADGITSQDMHIAGYIKDARNGVIIVVNKSDLFKEKSVGHTWDTAEAFTRLARYKFEFLPYAPLIFVSSISGKNVSKVLDLILEIKEKRATRVPTSDLNDFFNKVILKKPPVSTDKHQVNIKYATQADINPPTFVFFANYPDKVHFSYQRYLENRIREKWDFTGTPIRLNFRAKSKS
ncbi:MAG: ribosome biogenesis GTPase Der [bacterium]|nr:ribosome biogenesis GTPase Der [bacterium]